MEENRSQVVQVVPTETVVTMIVVTADTEAIIEETMREGNPACVPEVEVQEVIEIEVVEVEIDIVEETDQESVAVEDTSYLFPQNKKCISHGVTHNLTFSPAFYL
mgnify:CR=1 FL=1